MCKTERLNGGDQNDIAVAAALLRSGGTVAFPTETVYGLGANALNEAAVARIFAAKERPGWDPLIVHVSDATMMRTIASVPRTLSSRVECLTAAFWPGPLTLLLPRTAAVPAAVTAGRPLVGVRMPAHPVAMELIRLAGVPIAAPSANRFGRISPTTAAHVLEDLEDRIDAVLDGGATAVGVESTVLDVLQTPMVIYRPGAVTAEMIRVVSGLDVELYQASLIAEDHPPEGLPSPGVGLRHYAPRARLELVEIKPGDAAPRALTASILRVSLSHKSVGVMLPNGWSASVADETFNFGDWADEAMLAQRLFAGLRSLDALGVAVIVCPVPAGSGIAVALRDRLEKAARAK